MKLDADTQTVRVYTTPPSDDTILVQINQAHMSLASRIHQVEMQNDEILVELNSVRKLLEEFKLAYDRKTDNETEAQILLRKVGILS